MVSSRDLWSRGGLASWLLLAPLAIVSPAQEPAGQLSPFQLRVTVQASGDGLQVSGTTNLPVGTVLRCEFTRIFPALQSTTGSALAMQPIYSKSFAIAGNEFSETVKADEIHPRLMTGGYQCNVHPDYRQRPVIAQALGPALDSLHEAALVDYGDPHLAIVALATEAQQYDEWIAAAAAAHRNFLEWYQGYRAAAPAAPDYDRVMKELGNVTRTIAAIRTGAENNAINGAMAQGWLRLFEMGSRMNLRLDAFLQPIYHKQGLGGPELADAGICLGMLTLENCLQQVSTTIYHELRILQDPQASPAQLSQIASDVEQVWTRLVTAYDPKVVKSQLEALVQCMDHTGEMQVICDSATTGWKLWVDAIRRRLERSLPLHQAVQSAAAALESAPNDAALQQKLRAAVHESLGVSQEIQNVLLTWQS